MVVSAQTGISNESSSSRARSSAVRSPMQGSILVVDDNIELLDAIKHGFEIAGFETRIAASAEEALEVLNENSPDIIICDVLMPGMDGYEFYQTVLNEPELCTIPFVLLTAQADAEEVRKGKTSGCDEFLVKPFNLDDLIDIVSGKLSVAKKRKTQTDERLERYRRGIINTLSHEFRTPLVAISTGTELLLSKRTTLSDDRIQYLLESIQRGGLRLQRLVDDFMIIQQIESGIAETNAERLKAKASLIEIAESAIDTFQDYHLYDSVEINLQTKLSNEQAAIEVCQSQICDLINRLLSNSHKFAGTENAIIVSITSEGDSVVLTVKDYGPGLEKELAFDACKSFTQIGRDKLEQQGCGLGLTIAHFFAALNKSSLEFNSPDEGGFEVRVIFPKAK